MINSGIEARIREGLEQAQQGIFVPDKEMKEFFAQYADRQPHRQPGIRQPGRQPGTDHDILS